MTATDTIEAASKTAEFRARREASVRGAQGALALVTTAWVSEPTTIDGVPGIWAPAPTGDGLTVTPTSNDGDGRGNITVDGGEVDGIATVYTQSSLAPSRVLFDETRTGTVIGPDQSGRFALRVWDVESPAHERFRGIDAFDFNPHWVVTGRFEAVEGGVAFEHDKSQGGPKQQALSPGRIHVELEGQAFELLALPSDGSLQIVFADATTGNETYDVARFLFVRPALDGSVELDFNRAIVPPCSMSDQFNCPMPPASNRMPFAVTAGEKRPRFAD